MFKRISHVPDGRCSHACSFIFRPQVPELPPAAAVACGAFRGSTVPLAEHRGVPGSLTNATIFAMHLGPAVVVRALKIFFKDLFLLQSDILGLAAWPSG